MNSSRMIPLVLTGSILLAACQVLPERPAQPAVHDFGMTQADPAGPSAPWASVSVEAPEWLQEPLIRYRLLYAQPTQVRFYALDRWAAPPPELLASRLAANRSAEGYELKIELQAFEQIFEQPDRATALLRFHASAIDPVNGRLAAERIFRLSRPARSANAAGAVDAFSLLVEQSAGQLSHWVSGLPPPDRIPESKVPPGG